MLYFHNFTIISPAAEPFAGDAFVEGDQVIAIGPTGSLNPPAGCRRIEGEGRLLAPGYLDIQFNGGFGEDFTANPEAIWQVAGQLPRYGVTSFLPTIITSPPATVAAALEVIRKGPPDGFRGAMPLGLHIEGPMLNPQKKGAHNPAYLRPPSVEIIGDWSPQSGVRLVTLAPELAGAAEVIRALRQRGVVVSAGHTMATYDEAKAAFKEGVQMGTHLFNAMPPLDHRKPGLPGALLDAPGIYFGLIPDGIHVHPAMIRLAWRSKGPENFVIVTDAMAAMGVPSGRYWLGDFEVIVDETSARLANGTLAGSILTMDAAIRNMAEFVGCRLAAAIQSATLTPATLLGLAHKGRLTAGANADLIILNAKGHVQATLVSGQFVYGDE